MWLTVVGSRCHSSFFMKFMICAAVMLIVGAAAVSMASAADGDLTNGIAECAGGPAPRALTDPRAVLYEEDPSSNTTGRRSSGSVVWWLDKVHAATGQPADVAVCAAIEVPERGLKVTISLRRNADASRPVSHTVQMAFTLPPDFSSGKISSVRNILMKAGPQVKGIPLVGLTAMVTDSVFLLGLSNFDF
jgi:hypothetical protein